MNLSSLFKPLAQKQLDAYKPMAIRMVRDTAMRYSAQALTHTTAMQLQTDLIVWVTKSDLNPIIKTPLILAIVNGVTEANVALAANTVDTKMDYLTNAICGAIQGARL